MDCIYYSYFFAIFFLNIDSKARRTSVSLFLFNMQANLVTFLHFLLHDNFSSPLTVNLNVSGMFSKDIPHSSLEHLSFWQVRSWVDTSLIEKGF